MNAQAEQVRCSWVSNDELYRHYHDTEWGKPVTDEPGLFERLSLEGFQAGLSWITVLRKREAFRRAFSNFDIKTVANLTENQLDRLAENPELIRNRAKIQAVHWNANLILDQQLNLNSLIWSQLPPDPRAFRGQTESEFGTNLSTKLRKLGFKYVGPVSMHALAQAIGIIDDHDANCFLYKSA